MQVTGELVMPFMLAKSTMTTHNGNDGDDDKTATASIYRDHIVVLCCTCRL